MKIDLRVVAAVGFVFGASYELGRMAPAVIVRVLNKKFREDVRTEYKRRLRVVRTETPTGA